MIRGRGYLWLSTITLRLVQTVARYLRYLPRRMGTPIDVPPWPLHWQGSRSSFSHSARYFSGISASLSAGTRHRKRSAAKVREARLSFVVITILGNSLSNEPPRLRTNWHHCLCSKRGSVPILDRDGMPVGGYTSLHFTRPNLHDCPLRSS